MKKAFLSLGIFLSFCAPASADISDQHRGHDYFFVLRCHDECVTGSDSKSLTCAVKQVCDPTHEAAAPAYDIVDPATYCFQDQACLKNAMDQYMKERGLDK